MDFALQSALVKGDVQQNTLQHLENEEASMNCV